MDTNSLLKLIWSNAITEINEEQADGEIKTGE